MENVNNGRAINLFMREATGRRRNRVYAAHEVLNALYTGLDTVLAGSTGEMSVRQALLAIDKLERLRNER